MSDLVTPISLEGDLSTPISLEGEIDVQLVNEITWNVDSELSETSGNPVQNKVVTEALKNKKDTTLDESIDTMFILNLFS